MEMDIAVIGMSGRFPFAEDIASFHRNLREGKDCVRMVSEKRKSDCGLPENDYQVFGYLENIDKFDHEFFGISKGEALQMDPHQRQVMEVTYETIQNAGYSADQLGQFKTGFFLSCPPSSYENLIRKPNASSRVGNLNSMIPGRVARHFNLRGNALLVDTTCSSSLVSMVMAGQQLMLGEADIMLVCGANLILFPPTKGIQSDFKIVSSSGKAKSFAESADGTGIGEAVACVMLKSLQQAKKDGDTIHAIIKGGAINQDAERSSFLTAPSKVAQTEVIREAWRKSRVDPLSLGHLEAHGTGTVLGDPIEFDGVNDAFISHTNQTKFCGLSSVKSNIGHTNHAAGICGLIKSILSLKHQELFPGLHIDKPNPLISLENSAVYLNTTLKKWSSRDNMPRRSGISSFGVSGTNCHLVVEEAFPTSREQTKEISEGLPQLLSFSAKTEASLMRYLDAFKTYLSSHPNADFTDICYTLNSRRDHYNIRCCIKTSDVGNLQQSLSVITPENFKTIEGVPKLFFLFSDRLITDESLMTQFSFYVKQVEDLGQELTLNEKNLLFQYGFFKKLEENGLSSDRLLGIGLGEITISVILKEVSVEEGLRMARSYEDSEENLEERIRSYAKAESQDQNLVFLEIGDGGRISDILQKSQELTRKIQVKAMNFHEGNDSVLSYIQTAYLAGYPIKWEKIYSSSGVARVELPPYQFEKIPCWVEIPDQKPFREQKEIFHTLKWIPEELPEREQKKGSGCFLIFADSGNFCKEVTRTLAEREHEYVLVHPSDHFEILHKKGYKIDKSNPSHYQKLENQIRKEGLNPTGIICLPGFFLTGENERSEENLHKILNGAFHLTRSFASHFAKKNFLLTMVTSHAVQVSEDKKVNLSSAALFAFFKALIPEYPTLNLKVIDINEQDEESHLSDLVFDEIEATTQIKLVGIRGQQRYVQCLHTGNIKSFPQSDMEEGGTYIITGGANGIGYQMAHSIASFGPAKLILVGRTDLPARSTWDTYLSEPVFDHIADKIRNLKALEETGAEVYYHTLNIANLDEVIAFGEMIGKDFGQLDGVLHSAGVPGAALPITRVSFERFQQTLDPKAAGTLHMVKLCEMLDSPRLIINASLNTVFPQRNSVDYTVANALADAVALNHSSGEFQCISINWPGWKETGMSLQKDSIAPIGDDHAVFKALSNTEGLKAFHKILAYEDPHIIVAEGNLKKIQINPFFRLEAQVEPLQVNMNVKPKEHSFSLDTIEEVQQAIIQIWEDVLQTGKIEPTDDFFDLGGHSLNGGQIINRFENELAVEIEFETLLDFATPATLAEYVFDNRASQITGEVVESIRPAQQQEYYDVSHGQKRIWTVSQLDDTQFAFNMPGAYFYQGFLDVNALEKAFLDLISRHEILRTTFILLDDEIKQRIASADGHNFKLAYTDYSAVDQKESLVKALVAKEAQKPFDLENGPLLRANVIRLDEAQFVIVLVKHHIISDGWSMEIFIDELLAFYEANAGRYPANLPPLDIQYKDYAVWQNEQLSGETLLLHENYWLSQFKEMAPVIDLKTDFARPKTKTYQGGNVITFLENASAVRLNALSKENSSSSFMTLVALIHAFVFLQTEENDIVLGTPISGRVHKDLENQLGLFLNTLALRNTSRREMTFTQLLQEVRKNCLEAFEHQVFPFDLLVEKLAYETDPGRSPLFDIMVMFQKKYRSSQQSLPTEESDKKGMSAYDVEVPLSKYDLTFNFTESGDKLFINTEYNSAIYKKTTIELFNLQINSLLSQILREPDKLLHQYAIQLDLEEQISSSPLDIDFDF